MLIEVTQDDIEKGAKHSLCNCPVARAAKRATGQLALVHYEKCLVSNGEWRGEVSLPREATKFVLDFDAGYPVAPFSFELDLS